MNRRALLGLGSLAVVGCSSENQYFGLTKPPRRHELACATNLTSATLDAAKSADFREGHIIRALFEGLTNYHPETAEPMAGIATHYEISGDGEQVRLFLRGHPDPRGTRLPNTSTLTADYLRGSLAQDFARGYAAPPDAAPVMWSDGTPVTAHDVVYSWRRVLAPATAAPYAYLLYYIQNAQAVNAGSAGPEELAVHALGDYALRVKLRGPTPFFLRLLSWQTLRPVPRQAIETARRKGSEDAWTEPGNIVVSGPFLLRGQRSHDSVEVSRNPAYYEAGLVSLERIRFLLSGQATTATNLYRSGRADLLTGVGLPPVVFPTLSRKRDFRTSPAFGTFFPCFNTRYPPFDKPQVRHAFNMAINKNAIAGVFGGSAAAQTLVPPLTGYTPPRSTAIAAHGRDYDTLGFNPVSARELLASAGFPGGIDSRGRRLTVDLQAPSGAEARIHCEILKQQLESHLAVSVRIATQEFNSWLNSIFRLEYQGLTLYEDWGFYLDPAWFLDQFITGSAVNPSGWADPEYDLMLSAASATIEPRARMEALARCEHRLLNAMPFMPAYHHAFAYPQKPYVKGITPNVMDVHSFKHAWIDTKWRPA